MFAIAIIMLEDFVNCCIGFSNLIKKIKGLLITFLMALVEWGILILRILVLFRLLRDMGALYHSYYNLSLLTVSFILLSLPF